ncbi:hypothetical protein [Actinoplanes sp. NPDC051494]|uniref:hypothetical protein n=1 Tax=Actinoplanes sp. NPDC051494 TaxID=3363907 RepID=UPI0037BAF81A
MRSSLTGPHVFNRERLVATTVTVRPEAKSQPLNNPAWYQNQTQLLPPGNLASVTALAPRITRLWVSPDAANAVGGWAKDFPKFDQAAAYAGRIMINMVPCWGLFKDNPPTDCLERMETGLRIYKQRYPTLEYIEIFNETDDKNDANLTGTQYYPWYKRGYEMVNRVNADLDPAVPIKVGGPSASSFLYCPDPKGIGTGTGWLKDFLQAYADDTAADKKLDFISYHSYNLAQKEVDACGNAVYPDHAALEKGMVQDLLGKLHLPTGIPVHVTETGLFAADKTGTGMDGTPNDMRTDQLIQAAGMAALDTQYTLGEMDVPYHWVFNHEKHDRKSMFVDNLDGAVLPYYNVVRMQTMLKANLLSGTTVSTPLFHGRGINVLATSDSTGLAAMLTNYQAFDRTEEHTVTFDPGALPAGRTVRMDRYLVNATTSNDPTNAVTGALQRVESVLLAPGATAAKRVLPLKPNAVTLLVYTPLPLQFETEDLTTTATGGTATDIADADASGGLLNKFAGTGVGGKVSYTVRVPTAGTYKLALSVKKTPDRGIVQVAVDGKVAGTVDAGSTGYSFERVELGTHTLTAGDHTVSFALTGTSTGGWTVGVDYLTLD